MKFFSSVVPVCIFGFVLLFCANAVQAQSIMNSNGDVKSTRQYYADKAAAEAAAKRNAYTPTPSRSSNTNTSAPAGRRELTDEEKAAGEREMERAVEREKARKKSEAEAKVREEQRQAAFSRASLKYTEVTAVPGSYMLSRVKLNNKYGYINSWGTEVIPLVYDNAAEIFEHERGLVRSGKKWGFVDLKGNVIIPMQYDDAKDFINGTATVKLGNKWGLTDPQGKLVIPIKYDDAIIFDNQFEFAPVSIDGKYGSIDVLGQVRIPMSYDGLKKPSYGLMAAKQNGKWGFLDKKGDVMIAFQFDDIISTFSVPYVAPVPKSTSAYDGDLYGNQSATPTYIPTYVAVPPLALVTKDKAKFNINTGGAQSGSKTDIVTGASLAEVLATGAFTDNRENKIYSTIKIGDQVWMSQNLDATKFGYGEEIPEANSKKEWARANKEHKPAWCYYDNNPANEEKYGKLYNWYAVIDGRGIAPAGWHIPNLEEWKKLIDFMGGFKFAGNRMKNAVWGYSENPSGFSARPGGYRSSSKEGLFLLESFSTKWWSRNKSYPASAGAMEILFDELTESPYVAEAEGISIRCIQDEIIPVVIVPAKISSATTTAEVKPAEKEVVDIKLRPVQVKKKFGFMDESGTMVIKPVYDYVSFFNEGLVWVTLGKKCGFIDKTGNTVIPFVYDEAMAFGSGYARVAVQKKYGFIDKTNQVVVPLIYDDAAWWPAEGCISVLLNGKWGFIDSKNNTIIPFIYESVKDFKEGLAGVELNGKWGFIDKMGKVIIPLKYDGVGSFFDGIGTVYIPTGSRKIDKEGKEQ